MKNTDIENAYVLGPDGKPETTHLGGISQIDWKTYNEMRDDKLNIKAACKHCGGRVQTCHEKKMSDWESKPGFHHFDREAKATCPLTLEEDLRFNPFLNHSEFSVLEIDRNRDALREWENRNNKRLKYLVQTVVGKEPLSAEDQKILDERLERFQRETIPALMTMIGLAERPNYLPYILMGSFFGLWEREWDSGKKEKIGLAWIGGVQTIVVKDREGKQHNWFLPGDTLQLSHGGKQFNPVRSKGRIVKIEVVPKPVPIRKILSRRQSTLLEHLSQ